MSAIQQEHIPVLLNEAIEFLKPQAGESFIDCTFGGGGHTKAILERTAPDGKLLALDQDEKTLAATSKKLKDFKDRLISVPGNFRYIEDIANQNGFDQVSGILYDLGLSSIQLAGNGGFSFSRDDKLNMRFGGQGLTADDIVNNWSLTELRRAIKEYGEEMFSERIARRIVEERDKKAIKTSKQLAEIIGAAIPRKFWPYKIHPATRTFQAIRIAVNDELNALRESLPQAVKLLKRQGRIVAISFHSLEDRIVKDFFKLQADPCVCPKEFPVCVCGRQPTLKIITKKIVVPNAQEIKNNPRARSAKLRVAEKL